jgi:hypothetical protein
MRRPAQVPLDQTGFPLTLAGGLRTAFADVLSNPLPGHLAALMRRLSADRDECSGEEPGSRWPADLTTCSDIDMMSSNADGRFVHKDGTPYP